MADAAGPAPDERRVEFYVRRGGVTEFVHDDDAAAFVKRTRGFGAHDTRRASRVEPDGEGCWTADMGPSRGPVLGPFPTRTAALAAEVAWLREHALGAEACRECGILSENGD